MKRLRLHFLQDWLHAQDRKPLIIRGARQVGKTWIVRELAKTKNKILIEINFEKTPEHLSLFSTNQVTQIWTALCATFNIQAEPEACLLFLDEIQAAPLLLAKLRWFAEDFPALPVIAAGSLLEFVLAQHEFSMPVGRIQYLHLEPLSFEEFLHAVGRPGLLDYLKNYSLIDNEKNKIPHAIHQSLIDLFKEFLIVGGLPASVNAWRNQRSLIKINQIHHDLIYTYRDDFAKYSGRLSVTTLDKVMTSIPAMLGQKFVYSHVSSTLNHQTIKNALDLLNKARLCSPVKATAANGIPLGAEINDRCFKQILLDTGLASAMLGLDLSQLNLTHEIDLANFGALAEQVVGQLLRINFPAYIEPQLYYWLRAEKGSNAEVDYIIEYKNKVIPIEVKAGSTGSLKSLHLFMAAKELPLAIRINSDYPSQIRVNMQDPLKNKVSYQLLSIPFYLISEIGRLINLVTI